MFRWTLIGLLILTGMASAADPGYRIRLKEGSFAEGHVVGVDQADALGWQGPAFENAFRFDVRAVRSVTSLSAPEETAQDQPKNPELGSAQMIEMSNGSLLVGQLIDIGNEWITLETELLGPVQIDRDLAAVIIDAAYAGQIIYSGPIDDERWEYLGDETDWEFEAGALVATKQGAAVVGHVGLPARSQIDLSMSWKGTPDFVLSLGSLANNKISKVEEVPSAARLEVWANQLALVREVDGGADIAMLSDLSGANPRIDLTVYLDQEAGTIVVCDKLGRPLETLKVPSSKPITRTSVHLVNSGPSLTLERFEVREWDGITSTVAGGEKTVLDAHGEHRAGAVTGYDRDQHALHIAMEQGGSLLLPLVELRRGDLAPAPQTAADNRQSQADGLPPAVVQPPQLVADAPASARAASDTDRAEAAETRSPAAEASEFLVEVILSDRTRLSGRLLATEDPQLLRLAANGLKDEVQFPANAVRGVVGSGLRYLHEEIEKPIGTLKLDETQLAGYLIDSPSSATESKLGWHATTSLNASFINTAAAGAIIYRKPLPLQTAANLPAVNQTAVNRARVLAPAVGMFLGNKQPAGPTPENPPKATGDTSPAEAREIMFRTGDAIDGIVQRIDEQGMTFTSAQSTTTYAPHSMIQHVWLNRLRESGETSPEKLKRLMTVPRSMKADPPTHLFISVTGDYLRGRLVRLEGDQITIEVRLEQLVMSTSQIAQIIWLHYRDWDEKPAAGNVQDTNAAAATSADSAQAKEDHPHNDSQEPFLVHAIDRSDRGLTFKPQQLVDGILSGHSELLGNCSVTIANLNQLLFGRNISEQVRSFRADPWTLALAQYPRVYLEDGSAGAAPVGMNSELIDKPAIDFSLKSLNGEAFRLSKNHDRIVVLDFWASWCGPCIQTMPLVEEVVNELGVNQVHLVAVNIQETEARARAAVERLKMTSTVVLDIDGQAAAAYMANAIPQTVIIDRAGKVTHVFVGGGPQFVEQFRQALKTVVEGSPLE